MGWTRKIAAWGNSLAIRLPSQVFRKTTFREGDEVDCEIVDENTIRIRKPDDQENPIPD